jgi:hypothetical protein
MFKKLDRLDITVNKRVFYVKQDTHTGHAGIQLGLPSRTKGTG